MHKRRSKPGGGCDFLLYPFHSAWVAPNLRVLITQLLLRFYALFDAILWCVGAGRAALLGGKPDALVDALFLLCAFGG
jgi:hypothetical protein